MNIKNNKYESILSWSIHSDFKSGKVIRKEEKVSYNRNLTKITKQLRVKSIDNGCSYFKFSKYIVNKLFEPCEKEGYYRFVYDEDRKELNKYAGWSDNKKEYRFDRPIFY